MILDTPKRDVEDVVLALRKAREHGLHVNLLIGAGCSVTAGIPAADGMVEEVEKRYPLEFSRCESRDYSICMSLLTPSERRDLISGFVENASINWAHIAMAQLIKHGFVTRVLTTNFDNLVLRACSMVGAFPAVYDFASSSVIRSDRLFGRSVIHLHGQYTGFILCNTENEARQQAERLQGVFDDIKQQSVWIVVGYSGENDAVFELLANEETFEHRLFWVGFRDESPRQVVLDRLIDPKRYSFLVKGYDADDFFVMLAQELGCFPPEFMKTPFTHLGHILDSLTPYKLPIRQGRYVEDAKQAVKELIEESIVLIEKDDILMAKHFMNVGLNDELVERLNRLEPDDLRELDETRESIERRSIDLINGQLAEISAGEDTAEEVLLHLTLARLELHAERWKGEEKGSHTQLARMHVDAALHLDPESKLVNGWDGAVKLREALLSMESKTSAGQKGLVSDMLWESIGLLSEGIRAFPSDGDLLLYLTQALGEFSGLEGTDRKNGVALLVRCLELLEVLREAHAYDDELVDRLRFIYGVQLASLAASLEDSHLLMSIYRDLRRAAQQSPSDLQLLKLSVLYSFRIAAIVKSDDTQCALEAWQDAEKLCSLLLVVSGSLAEDELVVWTSCLKSVFGMLEPCNLVTGIEVATRFLSYARDHGDSSAVRAAANTIAYYLIVLGEYHVSRELLEVALCEQTETSDCLSSATLGLWNFRNLSVDVVDAEILGKKGYENAIAMAEARSSQALVSALQQKYYYEYALFLFRRKQVEDAALEYCSRGFAIGLLEGCESHYRDIQALMKELSLLGGEQAASGVMPDHLP